MKCTINNVNPTLSISKVVIFKCNFPQNSAHFGEKLGNPYLLWLLTITIFSDPISHLPSCHLQSAWHFFLGPLYLLTRWPASIQRDRSSADCALGGVAQGPTPTSCRIYCLLRPNNLWSFGCVHLNISFLMEKCSLRLPSPIQLCSHPHRTVGSRRSQHMHCVQSLRFVIDDICPMLNPRLLGKAFLNASQ